MNKKSKLAFILIFLLAGIISTRQLSAQEVIFDETGIAREMVLDEMIKTIRLYRDGWINSYPIMTTDMETGLILDFDELSEYSNIFSYRILHCDSQWRLSDLTEQEYQEGFPDNQVRDYEPSFNTLYNYIHYRLKIPNDDVRLLLSGNYLLVVYRDNNPEDVVFTKRFMVSEAVTRIDARANQPVLSIFRENSHEIDITVHHENFPINDPGNQTSLSIFQNRVWDYGIINLKPLFINPGELIYDYQEENIFPAGNEFRMFNTSTINIKGYHVQNIDYIAPNYHIELKPDEINPAYLYFDREDLNGSYYIKADNVNNADIDADYVIVHFTLKKNFPYSSGEIFITGALTNWQFNDLNKLTYNYERSAYTGSLLLKQGIYNYRYIYLPENSSEFDIAEIEGSHFETEDEYLILLYYRGDSDRYDRLVGHQVIHSGE